jgi:hypothetical protein
MLRIIVSVGSVCISGLLPGLQELLSAPDTDGPSELSSSEKACRKEYSYMVTADVIVNR